MVKVTKFHGIMGFVAEDLVDLTDETVYVVDGRIKVMVGEKSVEIGRGGCYYIPAGEMHTFEVLESGQFVCFFSKAGPNDPLPGDG